MSTNEVQKGLLAATAPLQPDGLPENYHWLPEDLDKHLDPKQHLDLKDPDKIVTLDALGYTDEYMEQLPTKVGQSSSFQILSQEGKEVLKQVVAGIEPHCVKGQRTPRFHRGGCLRSKFLYDLQFSVELATHISKIAGVALIPHPMMIMNSHLNFKPLESNRNTDAWHMDTVAFAVVIFCTEPDSYEGGKFEYFDGTLEEAKQITQNGQLEFPPHRCHGVGTQHLGWGIFQQGSEVFHHATAVTKGDARTTLVLSYESARVSPKDSCSRLAKTYTGLDHLDAMFADWLRYRCWRSKQRLMYLVDDNPDSLQAKDSLESLQHQLTDIALNVKYTFDRQFYADVMKKVLNDVQTTLETIPSDSREYACLCTVQKELELAVTDILELKASDMLYF